MRSVANPFATLLGNGVIDDKSVATEAKESMNGALKLHKPQSPTPLSNKENDGAAKSASIATNSRKSTMNGNGRTTTPKKIPLEANNPEILKATSSNSCVIASSLTRTPLPLVSQQRGHRTSFPLEIRANQPVFCRLEGIEVVLSA